MNATTRSHKSLQTKPNSLNRWPWQVEHEWRPLTLSEISVLINQSPQSVERLVLQGILLPTMSLEFSEKMYLGFFTYMDCLDAAIRLLIDREIDCRCCALSLANHVVEVVTDHVIHGCATLDGLNFENHRCSAISRNLQLLIDSMWAKFSAFHEQADLLSLEPYGVMQGQWSRQFHSSTKCSCEKVASGLAYPVSTQRNLRRLSR